MFEKITFSVFFWKKNIGSAGSAGCDSSAGSAVCNAQLSNTPNFVLFARAPSTRSSSLLTSAVVLLPFAFFPRAQRGKDGQSPNQNLEKFSSFEFLNTCT